MERLMVDRLLLGHYAPTATPELGPPGSDARPLGADHARPRITLYDTEQRRAESYRQTVAADLRIALLEDELTMEFQPVVDAATGRLVQAEGLARWTHPTYGPIAPDLFVVLAEHAGLMPTLTQWAL